MLRLLFKPISLLLLQYLFLPWLVNSGLVLLLVSLATHSTGLPAVYSACCIVLLLPLLMMGGFLMFNNMLALQLVLRDIQEGRLDLKISAYALRVQSRSTDTAILLGYHLSVYFLLLAAPLLPWPLVILLVSGILLCLKFLQAFNFQAITFSPCSAGAAWSRGSDRVMKQGLNILGLELVVKYGSSFLLVYLAGLYGILLLPLVYFVQLCLKTTCYTHSLKVQP
jgi:hypothetical protein